MMEDSSKPCMTAAAGGKEGKEGKEEGEREGKGGVESSKVEEWDWRAGAESKQGSAE